MEVRFEAKVTRGFSLSPRRFRDSLSPLRGLLLISFAKNNQEKPLGPGYESPCKVLEVFVQKRVRTLVTGLLLEGFVVIIHLTLRCSVPFQKDLFKGRWSLAGRKIFF